MDLGEQSPSYIAPSALPAGQADLGARREMGLNEKKIVKLASNENPSASRPRRRRSRERSRARALPDGNAFELKARSRAATAFQRSASSSATARTTCSSSRRRLLARARAVYSQHAFAVYPLATQARGATGIVVPAKTTPTTSRRCSPRSRRRRAWCYRQSHNPPGHSRRARSWRISSPRAARRGRGGGRGLLEYLRPSCATTAWRC